jgi:hypothetical protein
MFLKKEIIAAKKKRIDLGVHKLIENLKDAEARIASHSNSKIVKKNQQTSWRLIWWKGSFQHSTNVESKKKIVQKAWRNHLQKLMRKAN